MQGGAEVVLQAVPDEGQEVTAADMEQLVSVLDNRVNELGVSEPIIQVEGNDRLIVQLAGVDDPDQAIEIIGKTAQLEFVDPLGNVILTGAELEDAYAQIDNTKSANERNQVAFKLNEKGREAFFNATTQYVGQVISLLLMVKLLAPQLWKHQSPRERELSPVDLALSKRLVIWRLT